MTHPQNDRFRLSIGWDLELCRLRRSRTAQAMVQLSALSTAISTCRVANPPLLHKSFQPAGFKKQKRIILKLKQGGGGNGGGGQVV